ncbi:unnamed protein product [Oikopleura dioica]|uniref:Uncharacterized protein n=1 Tax=Oikopleura dioica TaxID=34765 RepID=E4Y989_OIKDI|nr:unnamed protein product [Oikopleura dioica]
MEEECVDYWRPESGTKCRKIYFSDVRSRSKNDFFEKLKKQNANIELLERVSKGLLKDSILILAFDEGSYLESFCDQLKNVEVLPIFSKTLKKKRPLEISNKEHIVVHFETSDLFVHVDRMARHLAGCPEMCQKRCRSTEPETQQQICTRNEDQIGRNRKCCGPTGPDGQTGQRGELGPEGCSGEPGEIGEPGEDGRKGEPGLRGDPGLRGRSGPAGSPGKDGFPGQLGEVGPDGPEGAVGQPGPARYKGFEGPQGPQGPPGPPGEAGEKGETGFQGDMGAYGHPGPDATRWHEIDEETKQRLFNEALTDLLENDYEVKMQLKKIVQYLPSEKFCDCKNNF